MEKKKKKKKKEEEEKKKKRRKTKINPLCDLRLSLTTATNFSFCFLSFVGPTIASFSYRHS